MPEAQWVSSAGILDFINALEQAKLELHSFMMLRHGKVIAEGWWEPYGPDFVHTMYSMSKSFTSSAVGFAVTEGKLSVDDKVIRIAASATWADDNTLVMTWRYYETPHGDTVTCKFDGDAVTITFLNSITAMNAKAKDARTPLNGRIAG